MDKTENEKLRSHIIALEKGYDNILTLLNEDIKTTEKDGVTSIILKDDKIKTYADGIDKLSDTLNKQYDRIKEKKEELLKLENPEEHKKEVADKVNKEHGNSHLNKRLQNG
jgi:hypothetical protein